MKVKRQNISENYNITSGWIRDFAGSIGKRSDFLSNVKTVIEKRNAPKTIEEKISDIKSRVGFDLVNDIRITAGGEVKEASCCSGCSDKKSPCDDKREEGRDELIALVDQMLKYIREFIRDREGASYGTVIEHCKAHPNLSWHEMSPRLDPERLSSFINSEIKKHKPQKELVEYIPQDDGTVPGGESDLPEFISHSIS